MAFASAFVDDFCVLSSQYFYSYAEVDGPIVATYETSSGYDSEDVESELSNEESHFYQNLLEGPIVQTFQTCVDLESITSDDFEDEGSTSLQEALEAYLEYKLDEDYDW
jgi:hypothetical protein